MHDGWETTFLYMESLNMFILFDIQMITKSEKSPPFSVQLRAQLEFELSAQDQAADPPLALLRSIIPTIEP